VSEAELRGATGPLVEESRRHGFLDERKGLATVETSNWFEHVERELGADDRGSVQEVLARLREPVEATLHDFAHAARDLDEECRAGLLRCPARQRKPQHLAHEKRIASGHPVYVVDHGRRRLCIAHQRQQARHLFPAEPPQLSDVSPARTLAHELVQGVVAGKANVAIGAEHEHSRRPDFRG
jgi:hypothetical protein